jgi:hypothetical protein
MHRRGAENAEEQVQRKKNKIFLCGTSAFSAVRGLFFENLI